MSYGDVAIGVECALPARFEARVRERHSRLSLALLLLVLAASALL